MEESRNLTAALVGFRLSTTGPDADLYCINIYDDERDFYLSVDGRIIVIRDQSLASELVALFVGAPCAIDALASGPDLVCDLPETLRLIGSENEDGQSTILNCVNAAIDLVSQVGYVIPSWARGALFKIADHLTFNTEFGRFLLAEGLKREELRDAVQLCVGAIVPHVLFADRGYLSLRAADGQDSGGMKQRRD